MFRVTPKGEGGCQEVRAPRTCPAVRMRRPAAAQGKASTGVLSALLPHPSGKGRDPVGDRWSGARRAESQGARPRHTKPRPPLKRQRLRSTQRRGDWGSFSGDDRLQVNNLGKRPRLWAKPRKPLHSSIPHLKRLGSWQQAFPLGPGTEPLSGFLTRSGAKQADSLWR